MEEQRPSPAGRAQRFQHYQRRTAEYQGQAERLARRSALVSNLRGLSFAIAVIGLVSAAFSDDTTLGVVIGLVALLAFLVLVVVHARVLSAEDLAWRFWRVNENASARARDEWQSLPEDGAAFADPEHPASGDLDVFGPRSLFQFINVAHTSYGQAALAGHLSKIEPRDVILERQRAVRELAPELERRQELEAYTLRTANPPGQRASQNHTALDLAPLIRWAEGEPVFLQHAAFVWGARLLPALTLAGFIASKFFGLPALLWALPLTAQLALSVRSGQEAARVFNAVSASPGAFARLRPTLTLIESAPVEAPLLRRLGEVLGKGERSASQQMRRFERVLGWFELRHNGMIYPFINVLLLWDIQCVVALEKWQRDSGKALSPWLEALGEWEALSSLAGVAYDNPDFSFPEIVAERSVFEATELGHPLISARHRVPNDVMLAGAGSALLVTGSNMSGKSTLLRAMGLAAVMGLAGSAVCATRLRISPMRVHTSMRISDSLSAGVSHFYAELKKLRTALVAAQGDYPVFFLLDEILHGTNSEERQIGARWVLGQLIEAGATGAVSTHDMALCELPPTLMHKVRTVHLRESVEGERMTFDYKVRPGPVSGGNALLLMRSLGLDVPVVRAAAAAADGV
ncbi:MAG TPA: DNA mismatch repair protein MutS [Polyangiaceae bacterium]|nr:DNA mismatch repair protein MutS [Polyangiaceae bacterium]